MTYRARSLAASVVVFALAWAGVTLAEVTTAEAQGSSVSPYFLVVLDNSGSMDNRCATFTTSASCTAQVPCTWSGGGGGSCSGFLGTNSCGQERTRMNDARCVLSQVVNAYGDATFGLMRYATTC